MNAATTFTQTAGTTYADLYKHQRELGLSHEAASQAATGAAMASGAVSAALGKVFSGGAQALNNPATREAAKKSFGAVLKSALKGAADEIPQEVLDGGFNHVVSEMSKGKTAKEAAASYLEQLPENMLTAGAMGGGVHAGSDLRGSRGGAQHASTSPTGYVDTNVKPPISGQETFSVASPDGPDVSSPQPGSPQQPRSPGVPITPTTIETGTGRPSSQQTIPENTTKAIPGSGSAPQPTTPSSAAPAAADPAEVGKVLGNIQRLKDKAKDGPLSLDEQRELDHHEKVLAQTRVKNLEKEQQVIRSLPQPRELDPHKTQVLADAKAVLARPVPGEPRPAPASSEPPIPDATTRSDSDSGKPSQTTANTRQPPQTPPAPPSGPPPNLQTAQARIHNIMNRKPEERGHPTTQADLAQAQQVVAEHVQKLESQPGPLSEAKQKELTDAKAALARLEPENGPSRPQGQSGQSHLERSQGGAGGVPTRRLGDALSGRPGGIAAAVADVSDHLKTQVPGLLHDKTHVFHSLEDLLNSDYAREHPLSKEDLDKIHSAEGFHDPLTGHSAIIAENVGLRPGETPHDALTRVILHERVGHDGLQTLLGSKDSKAREHWDALSKLIPKTELDAIANQEGYQHLAGDRNALAHEWFARQAEKSPHLLKKPGVLRDMWETFKGQLRKLSNHWKDTDESHLDTHLHELLRLSRKAALKRPSAAGAHGTMGSNAASPKAYPEGQLHTRQFSLASYAALRQREDKPSSWQEVKPGHRWMSAKQYLPRTGDKVPVFPILKRGSFQEKVNAVADWLKTAGPVTDPWGMKVNFDHPQKQGTQPTDIKNRAAHLLGENLNKDVEDRTERPDKIAWFGAVRKTIQDAQVRAVSKSGEVYYFRNYVDGIHMVVVDDGEVKDQANIITQYAPQSFDNKNKRYQDTRIEFARDATGTNQPR